MNQFYPEVDHDYQFEVNKDMHFAAAHYIPHEAAGQCSSVHGHTYTVLVTIGGNKLNQLGFLSNFQALKKVVHGRYDHTLLNNHSEFATWDDMQYIEEEGGIMQSEVKPPSTEVVAWRISALIQQHLDSEGLGAKCLQIIVRETPTSYVRYVPKDEEDQVKPEVSGDA